MTRRRTTRCVLWSAATALPVSPNSTSSIPTATSSRSTERRSHAPSHPSPKRVAADANVDSVEKPASRFSRSHGYARSVPQECELPGQQESCRRWKLQLFQEAQAPVAKEVAAWRQLHLKAIVRDLELTMAIGPQTYGEATSAKPLLPGSDEAAAIMKSRTPFPIAPYLFVPIISGEYRSRLICDC